MRWFGTSKVQLAGPSWLAPVGWHSKLPAPVGWHQLAGSSWRTSRFERPKSMKKPARVAPGRDFRRFGVNLGVVFRHFSRSHLASDSTRSAKGRTSVFAGRRSTFKGSQTLLKNEKSAKIDETSLRRRFASATHDKNLIFSFLDATQCRFWSPQRASGHSRALFPASRGALGESPGAPGTCCGRAEAPSRRSRDALGMLLDATARPERVPGAILNRFLVPQGLSRDRFSIKFWGDFQLILRASWPANDITFDG